MQMITTEFVRHYYAMILRPPTGECFESHQALVARLQSVGQTDLAAALPPIEELKRLAAEEAIRQEVCRAVC